MIIIIIAPPWIWFHIIFDWRQSKSWDEPANIKNTAKITYGVNWFFVKENFDHWKCSFLGDWLENLKLQMFSVLWTTSEDFQNCYGTIASFESPEIRFAKYERAEGMRKTVSFPDPSPAKLSVGCESSLITCNWPWSRHSREGRWGAFEETNDETEKLLNMISCISLISSSQSKF